MLTGVSYNVSADLTARLIYTPEQLDTIRRIETVSFNGFAIRLDDVDLITTVDGIQKQLDRFTQKVGVVYIAEINGGTFDIKQIVVEKI